MRSDRGLRGLRLFLLLGLDLGLRLGLGLLRGLGFLLGLRNRFTLAGGLASLALLLALLALLAAPPALLLPGGAILRLGALLLLGRLGFRAPHLLLLPLGAASVLSRELAAAGRERPARGATLTLLGAAAADHQEEDQQEDDRAGDPIGLSRVVVDEVRDGAGVDGNKHRSAQ